MHRSVFRVGVDPHVAHHLHVFPAGAAVQLVGSGQPAAGAVREAALLRHMVPEVRGGGLHGVLPHMEKNRQSGMIRPGSHRVDISLWNLKTVSMAQPQSPALNALFNASFCHLKVYF